MYGAFQPQATSKADTLLHSYIANVTRYHVAAILWAAPDDLVPALRDALFRHLTLQTALRVRITVCLEFILNHLQLTTYIS